MFHCLAIDPGKTTGICVFGFDQLADSVAQAFKPAYTMEIDWDNRFEKLRRLIAQSAPDGTPPPDIIIYENFRLRQGRAYEQSGSDFPSSQVIGIMGAYAAMMIPNPVLVSQEPTAMSRVAVYPGHEKFVAGSAHKSDAYKHAKYYVAMNHVSMIG